MDGTGNAECTVGLIGSGIGDSLSPALHEREAARLGLDYAYRLFDLDELGRDPAEVGALVHEVRDLGLRGVNVTHPCKQLVVPELDELSPEADALNAVNTIVFDGRSRRRAQHGHDRASRRRSRAGCPARPPSASCCSARAAPARRSGTRRWGSARGT